MESPVARRGFSIKAQKLLGAHVDVVLTLTLAEVEDRAFLQSSLMLLGRLLLP